MSIKQRLKRGGIWAGIGKVGAIFFSFLISLSLTRILAPNDLGIYFLTASLIQALTVVGLFGVNRLVVKLIAESLTKHPHNTRKIFLKAMTIALTGMLVVAFLYSIFISNWLSTFLVETSHIKYFHFYVVIWLLLWGAQIFISEALRGFHDIRSASIFSSLLYNFIFATGCGYLWFFQGSTTLSFVLSVVILGLFVNFVLGGVTLIKHLKQLNNQDSSASSPFQISQSFYLMVTSISLLLINDIHLWVVGYFLAESDVAQFGMALRLINFFIVSLAIINLLIPSSIADLYAQNDLQKLRRLMGLSAVFAAVPSLILLLCAILWGDLILLHLFGTEYESAYPILIILAVGNIINVITGVPGSLLMMSGNEKKVMLFSVSGGAIGIIITLMLTPKLGAIGAAYGIVATISIHNILMWAHGYFVLKIDTRLQFHYIKDLYSLIRSETESRLYDNKIYSKLESFWRVLELTVWKLKGYKVINCFGDSHARIFRHLNSSSELVKLRFQTVSVRGATTFGLGNPNSKTNSLKIFLLWLAKLNPKVPVLFMLGEVDTGFLIWWRARKYELDPEETFQDALTRYKFFLKSLEDKHQTILVVSAPLPTIPDDKAVGDIAKARNEIDVNQLTRTELTLRFNKEMGEWCKLNGHGFLDLDITSLDKKTGLVKSELVNMNKADHHYNKAEHIKLLVNSLNKNSFLI